MNRSLGTKTSEWDLAESLGLRLKSTLKEFLTNHNYSVGFVDRFEG